MLHALLEYADKQNLAVEPGLKPKMVRWLLSFNTKGDFLGVHDYTGGDKKKPGRIFPACPDLTQQEMVAAGAGTRHFLVDTVEVIALLTKDGEVDDKLRVKHASFVDHLNNAAVETPSLTPVAEAMQLESNITLIHEKLTEYKAKPNDNATFAIEAADADPLIFVEQRDWLPWWRSYRENLAQQRAQKSQGKSKTAKPIQLMRCLLSGELVEPQPTHNKIEGLSDVGGLSMGDAFTSFDKDAYSSFELSQGENAAMSEEMVKAYTLALNHLVRNRGYSLAGTKIVYWYSHEVEPEIDPIKHVTNPGFDFGDAENPAEEEPVATERDALQAESRAQKLLGAIRSGDGKHPLQNCRFYAMTLSANSGRVVIRDWMEGAFEELAEAVAKWFADLAIISRDGKNTVTHHKFAAVLAAGFRDLKDAPAPLTTSLWRSALRPLAPLPGPLVAQTLARIKVDLVNDDAPRHARFAVLKAFCNRNERLPEMNAELNKHERHPAYLCGRIMAMLANIQHAAMPNVGVGVVQRYYAAASATPALVLGRLTRTAQIAHLPKISSDRLRKWFENQLAEIWQQLEQAPPSTLSLEGQTLFAMGYYQQQAQKKNASADADADGDSADQPATEDA